MRIYKIYYMNYILYIEINEITLIPYFFLTKWFYKMEVFSDWLVQTGFLKSSFDYSYTKTTLKYNITVFSSL